MCQSERPAWWAVIDPPSLICDGSPGEEAEEMQLFPESPKFCQLGRMEFCVRMATCCQQDQNKPRPSTARGPDFTFDWTVTPEGSLKLGEGSR